jgi:hypothetical protein
MAVEKAPSMATEKAPSYYIPVSINGIIGEDDLKALLLEKYQEDWITKKRVSGLLLILNYFTRNLKGVSMSSELSRQYVSTLKRGQWRRTKQQPLALLTFLGLIVITQKAIATPHRKQSARYKLNPAYGTPKKIEANLSRQQVMKIETATERQEIRLNRKNRTRGKILSDLATISLSNEGMHLAVEMTSGGEKSQAIARFLRVMKDPALRKVTTDPSGTIFHYVKVCPRELKPQILLAGKPVSIVDMKAAHLVCLICVARDRIKWMTGNGRDTKSLVTELDRYQKTLQNRDIYEELGGSGSERKQFKLALLMSLNMATPKAIRLPQYQKLKTAFPSIVGIIEDLKKNDHRALSKQLQYFTAQIIESATFAAQNLSIPCLPDTDALIVPEEHKDQARQLLNQSIWNVTGLDLQKLDD